MARFRFQWALDPALFARELLGFHCDPVQARFLRSGGCQRILCCTRQWGKSTVTAILAVHRALFREKSLILIFSHTDRQAMELLEKVTSFLKLIPGIKDLPTDNKHEVRLPNGSRIVALPENPDGVRGYSAPSMVIVDEAAYVSEELFRAIGPMRATVPNSCEIWMSSPAGKKGAFFEAWENGDDYWERFLVPATECPRITADFLELERRKYGDLYLRQEYMCEFVDSINSVFTHEQVMSAMADYEEPTITIK
jgi:hypothetical protein